LSVVILTSLDLQVMAATKHLYNIFEWSREIKKVGEHWLKQTN